MQKEKIKRSRDVLGLLKRLCGTLTWLVCLVEAVLVHFGGAGLVGVGRTDALCVLLEVSPNMIELKALFDEMNNL